MQSSTECALKKIKICVYPLKSSCNYVYVCFGNVYTIFVFINFFFKVIITIWLLWGVIDLLINKAHLYSSMRYQQLSM